MFLLWQRRGGEREWGESKKDVSPLAKKGGEREWGESKKDVSP